MRDCADRNCVILGPLHHEIRIGLPIFFMIHVSNQIDHCTVMRTVVATYGLSERAIDWARAHSFRSARAPRARGARVAGDHYSGHFL